MTVRELINEELSEFILNEKMTKEQQESGQREMMNRNTVFTRLKEYLDNKWNSKNSPLNKYQLKQKLNEYRRFEEIKKIGKNSRNKTDKNVKTYITKTFGKKPEWQIEKGSTRFTSTSAFIPKNKEDEPKISYLKSKERIKNSPFQINSEEEKIVSIFNKYELEHEYGHLYNWLKKYIISGKLEPLINTLDKNKIEASKSEGKADNYAFNNLYRKDRRVLLKDSNLSYNELKISSKLFNRVKDIEEIKKLYAENKITLEQAKSMFSSYIDKLYKNGMFKEAKNIISILNSIGKEGKK